MVGPFGLRPRGTMRVRALPMAKALVERNHEVTILLPPWQNREDAGRQWEEDGVAVENIILPASIPGHFHAATGLRLIRRVMAFRPDVVHFFKPKAYSGLVHWALACLPQRLRPRLVVDADDWEGPGGWNELAEYSLVQRRFFTWQERWGLTHADAVTVASRTLESLTWALGVSPQNVYYVPNGARGRGGPRGEGQGGRPSILLYTRFFEFPSSRVIELFQLVRERVPQARLLIVGEGLFGEEEELFRQADRAGLEVARPLAGADRLAHGQGASEEGIRRSMHAPIFYTGWVPSDTLSSYFRQADLAIYPFDDNLVNRAKCAVKLVDLLEAGVPVVAEAVGQNREYVRDGKTGFLIEPGNVKGFAEAVVRLLEDPALAGRLGRAAARDLEKRFSWHKLVDRVERAYGVPA